MSSDAPTAETYGSLVLEQAPRVLSMMDREVFSPTLGCCDRNYWAWKFVDFPGARFQESLCVLSFLYSHPMENNQYFQNERVLEWIGNGMRYWASLQHQDGSFDEAYPFERSLAATSFTAFYVSEAIGFAGEQLPRELLSMVQQTLRAAGAWLLKNDETHGFLSNHLAAAAAALYHVYRMTGDKEFEQRSEYFLQKIIAHQSSEGWYEEYGGADPGYQTHGSFYLARYWQLSQNAELEESLGRSMAFLEHFVHSDGSIGGEYASRNTQTYYPAAFEMLAASHSSAARISRNMRASAATGSAAGIRCVDAYNFFPFLNNLAFAYLAYSGPIDAKVISEPSSGESGMLWFPEAGIARVRKKRYDAYVGAAKGGVIKVFDRSTQRLVCSDCGYVGRLDGGQTASTQYEDHARHVEVTDDRIDVEGVLSIVPKLTMKPIRFVAFRLFSLSIGRFAGLGRWLKRRLVQALIYRRQTLNIAFSRTIEFADEQIRITDRLHGPDGIRVETLQRGWSFTTIHMGSSKYFISNELVAPDFLRADATVEVDVSKIATGLELQQEIRFPGAEYA